jgi:DNA-binding LacI/PurR family transcriptional regulator
LQNGDAECRWGISKNGTVPQLTAIGQPLAVTFSKAVELLINPSVLPQHQLVVVSGSLAQRNSTAPPDGHA